MMESRSKLVFKFVLIILELNTKILYIQFKTAGLNLAEYKATQSMQGISDFLCYSLFPCFYVPGGGQKKSKYVCYAKSKMYG